MANANVDVVYEIMQIILMTLLMKKIIANTLDDEKVRINIKTSGDV